MALPGQIATASAEELAENPCEGFNEESCGKPSVYKVVGETDSMGSEHYFQCTQCREKEREWLKANPTMGDCKWCKASDVRVFPHRDFEEGMNGPVYEVCQACITKESERLREELDEQDEECYLIPEDPPEWLVKAAFVHDGEEHEFVVKQAWPITNVTLTDEFVEANTWASKEAAMNWINALPLDTRFICPSFEFVPARLGIFLVPSQV